MPANFNRAAFGAFLAAAQRGKPTRDQALALGVELGLATDGPERERLGDRLEGGGGDGEEESATPLKQSH